MQTCGQIHLHPTTNSLHLHPLTLTKALTHPQTTITTKPTNHHYNPRTNSYKTTQLYFQATLNLVIIEKALKHQTIHLTTSIQIRSPHKLVTQTNYNTPCSTYQPLQTNYAPQWPHPKTNNIESKEVEEEVQEEMQDQRPVTKKIFLV